MVKQSLAYISEMRTYLARLSINLGGCMFVCVCVVICAHMKAYFLVNTHKKTYMWKDTGAALSLSHHIVIFLIIIIIIALLN